MQGDRHREVASYGSSFRSRVRRGCGSSYTIPAAVDVDKAVYAAFAAAAKMKPITDRERIDLDELAIACISRLVGKDHDVEFRAFVSELIKAADSLPVGNYRRRSLESLRAVEKRLGK